MSLEKLLAHDKHVRYLCQDETRLGMKTLTGKAITAPGVKPTVEVKWGRENFWIYGAIEPLTGNHFFHEYPKLNGYYCRWNHNIAEMASVSDFNFLT